MQRQSWIGVLVVLVGILGLAGPGYGIVLPSGLVYEGVDSDWVNTASWLGAGNYCVVNGDSANTSASFYVDLGSVQTVTSFNLTYTQYDLGWWNIKELKVHHSIGEGGTFVANSSASYDTATPLFSGIPGGSPYDPVLGDVRSIPLTSPTAGRYFMIEVVSNGIDPYYLDPYEAAYFGDFSVIAVAPTTLILNPDGGALDEAQNVVITCVTSTAVIRYTTNGSDPSTSNGTQIISGGTILVDRNMTLKALAWVNGEPGEIKSATYTIVAKTPTFSIESGNYTSAQTVTIDCATPEAIIHYTTDGLDPTESSPIYNAAIAVDHTMILKAKAYAAGRLPSNVNAATYAFGFAASIPQATLTINGTLSDWPTSAQWSSPYMFWYGTKLTSNTQAKFAWNDAQNVLYVAVQTNETNLRPGGFLVVGLTKDTTSVPTQNITSTQLGFKYDTTKPGNVEVVNETGGTIEGIVAACSYDSNIQIYTYEIAIPLWSDWRLGQSNRTQLDLAANNPVYLYSCMQDNQSTINGTTLSCYGNPLFYQGANATPSAWDKAAVLTLAAPSLIPGDANGDGMVDVGDLGILAANYGGSGKDWAKGDFNGDTLVDVGDLGILAAHYGQNSTQTSNFSEDYAKAFGTTASDDAEDEATTGSSVCTGLGLPLIAGLMLAGLMLLGSFKSED
jgi:hypothetical protein